MKNAYEIQLHTEADTIACAAKLAQMIAAPCVIFLQGDLGAGKTTFVRSLLQVLGVTGRIKSPTYALVEEYTLANQQVAIHFDFYRIHSVDELDNIGLDEYFKPTSICLVEWPEQATSRLPTPDIHCYLSYLGDERVIRLVAISDAGDKMLQEVFKSDQAK